MKKIVYTLFLLTVSEISFAQPFLSGTHEFYLSTSYNSNLAGIRNNAGNPVLNSKSGGILYLNRDVEGDTYIQSKNNGNAFTIASFLKSGNVGIGTTAPVGRFDINPGGWGNIPKISFDQTSDHPSMRLYRPTGATNPKTAYPWWVENSSQGKLVFKSGSPAEIGLETVSTKVTFLANGNVGIGTGSPSAKLDVFGNIHFSNGLLQVNHTYEDWGNVLSFRTKDNNHYGDFRFEAEHTDTGTVRTLMYLSGDKNSVGIGTEDTGNHELAVEGSIGAREIKVEANGWSDFVFEDDYELSTLEEVEKHISEKGHLQEIPSEAEVTENGINLGEMDAKLLQKIEELTLYMIDMNKQVQQLKAENKELKSKFED